MGIFSPVRLHDQIFPFVKEIGDRNYARCTRFPTDGFQEKNCLRAEFASNPSLRTAEEEGIDPHEPFDEGIFHCLFCAGKQGVFYKLSRRCEIGIQDAREAIQVGIPTSILECHTGIIRKENFLYDIYDLMWHFTAYGIGLAIKPTPFGKGDDFDHGNIPC